MLAEQRLGAAGCVVHLDALEAHHAFAWITQIHLGHQEITLVYICRIRMRLYVIKSLNDIYMSKKI